MTIPMTTTNKNLQWLKSHKGSIHKAANIFIRFAINQHDQTRMGNPEETADRVEPLTWEGENKRKEIVLGCILAFASCSRSLSLAHLNRLVNLQTSSVAGVEPLSVVADLRKLGIIELEMDDPADLKEQFIELLKNSIEILTGLYPPQCEKRTLDEGRDSSNLPHVPTPILLLKLGEALELIARSNSSIVNRRVRNQNQHRDTGFVEEASKVLTRKLIRLPEFADCFGDNKITELDSQIIAILFTRKLTMGLPSDLRDFSEAMGTDNQKTLMTFRRLMYGPLMSSGLLRTLRASHFEMQETLFDALLLDSSETVQPSEISITVFSNRIKSVFRSRSKNKDDDGSGDYASFEIN